MNICSDNHQEKNKSSTSGQLYRHVKDSETTMHDVRDLMLDILAQYQKVDKVGLSLGVLDKISSFTDSVSWCAVIGKLDHHKQNLDKMSQEQLVKLVDYLETLVTSFDEKVILKIQQYRDLWMKKVLLWDGVVLTFVMVALAAGLYGFGAGLAVSDYIGFIKQRPFFFLLMACTGLVTLSLIHFIIRRRVLNNIISGIDDELSPGMNLVKALNLNARIRYSIFRPVPVGWNFLQRQRLASVMQSLTGIRDKLAVVLVDNTGSKAA